MMPQPHLPLFFDEPVYGRAPDICVDSRGRCHAAWISCGGDGECIRISTREPHGEWSPPQRVVSPKPFITGVAVAPWGEGVLLAWIDGGDNGAGLKLKAVGPGRFKEPRLVAGEESRPAHPDLSTDAGRIVLVWTEKTEGFRKVRVITGAHPTDDSPAISLSDGNRMATHPSLSCSGGRTLVVWQEIVPAASAIVARAFDDVAHLSEMMCIDRSEAGILALPAICAGKDGFWICWQSDVDADHGPGLVRGIDVAYLDRNNGLHRPVAPPPPVPRQGKAQDQGFESPTIASPRDGRLVIIGRGSQSVRRQDLGEAGWSGSRQIDAPGWSCRGRRFPVCASPEGLFIVGREREGLAVRRLELAPEHTGFPPLTPVRMPAHPSSGMAPVRDQTEQQVFHGYRVLFGDIHQHTIASDGTGTAEEVYQRARSRYGDVVVAVSDHESFLGKRTEAGEWRETCRIADEFYEPGAFVTLHAFEWTGKMYPGPGHKVVYLPSGDGPMLSRDHERTRTAKGLLLACRQLGALAIPHHVGWTGADMENHLPKVQTCFEIVSCHGAYERPGMGPIGTRGDDKEGQFIGDALDRNLRFGFVGGSDGHGLSWHHGVSRKQDSHRTGLTGFLATERTRAAVWQALKRRRCFATSGAKIGLWFEVDGRPMGEEIFAGVAVPFRVIVSATAPLRSVMLVSNGGQEIALDASGRRANIFGTLPPPPDGGFSYYYVRAVQEDEEVAWSSPVWLDPLEPA